MFFLLTPIRKRPGKLTDAMDTARSFFIRRSVANHMLDGMNHICSNTLQRAIEESLSTRLSSKRWVDGMIRKLDGRPTSDPSGDAVARRRIVAALMRELLKNDDVAKLEQLRQAFPESSYHNLPRTHAA